LKSAEFNSVLDIGSGEESTVVLQKKWKKSYLSRLWKSIYFEKHGDSCNLYFGIIIPIILMKSLMLSGRLCTRASIPICFKKYIQTEECSVLQSPLCKKL
jgi:hypothetical protein